MLLLGVGGGGVAPASPPVLARPTIASASSVLLAWTGGTGSDLIERSTNAGSSWSTVASGQATPYTATGQTEITSQDVWYRVKAGGAGDPSNSGIVRLFSGAGNPAPATWTAPADAVDARFDGYGAGFSGAGDGTGGGGGAFSRTAVSSLSGDYNITVDGPAHYYYSSIVYSGGTIIEAKSAQGAVGGIAANGIGDLCTSGGNGGAASNGSGGGAGGPNGNGGDGSSGGIGGAGGGGLAGDGGGGGGPGLNFGGGGSGADFSPGAGAPGAVAVTCTKAA